MDDETKLREAIKAINTTISGYGAYSVEPHWSDLRSEHHNDGNKHSISAPIPHPRSMTTFPYDGETYNIIVDKTTHRIRFQDETESGVVIVIEPREQ